MEFYYNFWRLKSETHSLTNWKIVAKSFLSVNYYSLQKHHYNYPIGYPWPVTNSFFCISTSKLRSYWIFQLRVIQYQLDKTFPGDLFRSLWNLAQLFVLMRKEITENFSTLRCFNFELWQIKIRPILLNWTL